MANPIANIILPCEYDSNYGSLTRESVCRFRKAMERIDRRRSDEDIAREALRIYNTGVLPLAVKEWNEYENARMPNLTVSIIVRHIRSQKGSSASTRRTFKSSMDFLTDGCDWLASRISETRQRIESSFTPDGDYDEDHDKHMEILKEYSQLYNSNAITASRLSATFDKSQQRRN